MKHFVKIDEIALHGYDENPNWVHVLAVCPPDIDGCQKIDEFCEFDFCTTAQYEQEVAIWFDNPNWATRKEDGGWLQPGDYTRDEFWSRRKLWLASLDAEREADEAAYAANAPAREAEGAEWRTKRALKKALPNID
ncbi:MAG: hypothetical protein ACRC2U_20835 [Aeromonas sp.]